jgi:hypothetical protein
MNTIEETIEQKIKEIAEQYKAEYIAEYTADKNVENTTNQFDYGRIAGVRESFADIFDSGIRIGIELAQRRIPVEEKLLK